jgi:hypothetical protein
MSPGEPNKPCTEISPLLVFYVCDEVNDRERAEIERHLAECSGCRGQLAEEREFQAAVISLPGTDEQGGSAGILLSQCRSELAEKLDDLERPAVSQKVPAYSWFRGWMTLHPAWSAATLVLLGLVAGTQYSQWASGGRDGIPQSQAVNVHATSRLTDDQLSKMAVAGINFTPSPYSGSKNVRVLLSSEQPVELNGNLDDSDVRSVLTYVVRNGRRFDSGVRLDCLDALKSRAEDAEVRGALLCAARKDGNPAVRLKALEALRNAGADSAMRQVLLEALKQDSNPGVRVEAVNLLVRSLEEAPGEALSSFPPQPPEIAAGPFVPASAHAGVGDGSVQSVIRTFEELRRNDPSRYVRLRSAAALREVSARNDQ